MKWACQNFVTFLDSGRLKCPTTELEGLLFLPAKLDFKEIFAFTFHHFCVVAHEEGVKKLSNMLESQDMSATIFGISGLPKRTY